MQGSLDDPPIVIRSSQWKATVFLLISLGFVAIAVLILQDPKESHWPAWLGIALFGLGIPVFGLRLVRPDRLTLTPDGITWRSPLRTTHWTWNDVQSFRPYVPAPTTVARHVGFDFTETYRGRDVGLRGTAKALTGVEGSLGSGWEMGPAELCDLLNNAQRKWRRRDR
jgi:Bacterial PH domain